MRALVASVLLTATRVGLLRRLLLRVAGARPGRRRRLRRFFAANHVLPERVPVSHARGCFAMLTGSPTCLVAQLVWLHGSREYEPPLPDLVPALAANGPSVVVGANSGYYALLLAQHTGARVVAFEPYPPALARLRHNVDDNGLSAQVEVCPRAVGTAAATLPLHVPRLDHGWLEGSASLDAGFKAAHSGTVDVDVTTLDAEALGSPELVLIDVEGLEAEVLAGAPALLRETRPFLVVEVSDASVGRVADLMTRNDYVSFEITPGGLRQQESLRTPTDTEAVVGSATRSRYWNAVLAPRERVAQARARLAPVVTLLPAQVGSTSPPGAGS